MNLFEVPVYVEKLKLDNKFILQYCKKLKQKDKGIIKSNFGGWHSSSLQGKHSKLNNLFNQIEKTAFSFSTQLGKKTPIQLKEVWININNFKDSNQLHFHPHSFLSGVYYVNFFKNGGNIVFENPAQDVMASNWNLNDMKEFNTFNSAYYKIVPNTGDLMLFPSWLKHSVEPNMTNKDRVSISFNLS